MPRQPKAGDICHRMGKGRQQSAGWAIGEAHLRQRLRHGLAQKHLRQALHRHFCRHHRARANRFGQQKHIARLRAAFGNGARGKACDGKADGQLGPDRAVAADNICASGGKDLGCGGHDLGQHLAALGRGERRQGDLRQRHLRLGPHCPDIAQSMQRRDPCHQPRVLGKGAQMVGGQHLHPVGGGQNRRVITAPRQNLGALRCGHRRQGCRQICRPQLGTAAAAKRLGAHRLGQAQGRLAGKIARHRRVVGKFLHKGAVDAVFPLPKPTAIQRQAPFVGDSPAPACRDQLEVIALRRVAAHPPTRQRRAQIGQQNRRLAHGIDPRLGPWRKAQMRAIACGKNRRIRALQRRPHSDKAFVCFDPDLGQPVLRPPPRHRQGEIRGQAPPVFQQHRIGLDRHRFGPGDQRHSGLCQMLQQGFARAAPDQRQRTGPALHQRDLAAPAQAIG